MKYDITGDNLQMVNVHLDPGESIHSTSGAMRVMTGGVEIATNTGGGVWKGLKRSMSGGTMFMTTFTANGSAGMVCLGGRGPGKIIAKDTSEGDWLAQQSAYLASEMGVDATLAFQKRFSTALFGGEGLVIQRISGHGLFFLCGCGDFVELDLAPGEVIRVSTSNVVAWKDTVQYEIERLKGAKNVLFSGEGLFVTTLTGPGPVILQSMTLGDLAYALIPYLPRNTS